MPLLDLPLELLDTVFDNMEPPEVMVCATVCSALRVPAQRSYFSMLRIESRKQLAHWCKASSSVRKGEILHAVRRILGGAAQRSTAVQMDIQNRFIPTYVGTLELTGIDCGVPDLSPFANLRALTLTEVSNVKTRRHHAAPRPAQPRIRRLVLRKCHPTFVHNLIEGALDLDSIESLVVYQSSGVVNALLERCTATLVDLHIQTKGLEYEDARAIRLNIPSTIKVLRVEVQCGSHGGGPRQAKDIYTIVSCIPRTSALHTIVLTSTMQIRFTRILDVVPADMNWYAHAPNFFTQKYWTGVADLLRASRMTGCETGAVPPLRVCFHTTVHHFAADLDISDPTAVLTSDIEAWAERTFVRSGCKRINFDLDATVIEDIAHPIYW